jgi:propionyl-CoA synthetase
MGLEGYEAFYGRSIEEREAFWAEEARGIEWRREPESILDYSEPPFSRWFVGGETNLCHNAVDRHLRERGDGLALIHVSTETGERRSYTYRELYREVNALAAALGELGVGRGDRVIIYLPMVPEAVFAMLACARIGAVHSVVFGGFAAPNLAARIDDARPKVLITADAGSRGGKVITYKPIVDSALEAAAHPPGTVVVLNRGLAEDGPPMTEGRDRDYGALRERHLGAEVPVEWLESSEPSYVLYTSGTTGTPKGIQRDTGGYAVALETSMRRIFGGEPGETMFTASDIGWVVGHSYIVYAPLLRGMATVVYEGLPTRPDPGIWWEIVEEHKVSVMFTAPTAIRALKAADSGHAAAGDLSSLHTLFLAGEPLDAPTYGWATEALGVPVRDNYWQTETGWPILTASLPGLEDVAVKPGSAGFPVYGYDVRLVDERSGEEVASAGERGVLAIAPPLPPGCASTIWGDDERFVQTYFSRFPGRLLYSTFDWATRDGEGYHYILGRSDDVINVSGHRLGTREIEEAISSHPRVAEAAAVGVADSEKGQTVHAFVVLKGSGEGDEDPQGLASSIRDVVAGRIGTIARPAEVHVVPALPKTRSGKLLRRGIQALAEGRDPGEMPTIEDPAALEGIKATRQGAVAR